MPHALAGPRNYQKYRHFLGPFALARFRSPRTFEQNVGTVHFLCSFEKKEKERKTPEIVKGVDEVACNSPYKLTLI